MSDVTRLLNKIESGDGAAAEHLLPLVYEELRNLAAARMQQESNGHTLQPTALVHEAYLRLVDNSQTNRWESRAHFFAAAAEAMRRILVDRARRKARPKHGGDRERVNFEEFMINDFSGDEAILAVHEALELLEREDETKAKLVKLRYFAGLTLEETAAVMKLSRATASRYWTAAKARLYCNLEDLLM
jgi:RNA polymerase sigma factor (TIGR02999 family)